MTPEAFAVQWQDKNNNQSIPKLSLKPVRLEG